MGFPTANMVLTKKIPEGIYLSHAIIKEMAYPALTFIGSAITFDEKDIKSETYFLTKEIDLYGLELEIGIIKKIRDNQKFNTSKELVAQMSKDEQVAREYFKI